MKLFFISLIFSLTQVLNASDFDNWFFKFNSQQLRVTAIYTSPEGTKMGTSSGITEGSLTKNGNQFLGSGKIHYLPQNETVTAKIIWEKVGKNTYKGAFKASNGNTAITTLTLIGNKQFKTKTVILEKLVTNSEGKLDSDGKMRSKGTLFGPENQEIMHVEEIHSLLPKKVSSGNN